MSRLRVAIVADMLEERWASMDLVADMLLDRLGAEHGDLVDVEVVRPPMRRRASLLTATRVTSLADRVANRFWDYPRLAAKQARAFDVFHVVDHSYSQLVHVLPAARTLVTCHDLDTFRSVLQPGVERRSAPFRAMTRRILDGVRRAGHVACDTEATRDGLVRLAAVPVERTTVVHNGPHPSCTPVAEATADAEASRLVGRWTGVDLLHVGTTVPRKRIDTLLRVFADVKRERPEARLIRVGGPLTGDQRRPARALGVEQAIVSIPFVDRATLAAIYRHCTLLLLTSDREGFGLPVLEALACGTPVIASGIAAVREVGGDAVTYCAPGDVDAWQRAVLGALTMRDADPGAWQTVRQRGIARAAAFSWSRYASDVLPLYFRLAARPRTGAEGPAR